MKLIYENSFFCLCRRQLRSNYFEHVSGQGLECRKVNFLEYLGQGILRSHTTSKLAFKYFSSPTNIHTHSRYSHPTSTSLHLGTVSLFLIFFIFYILFFEIQRGFLPSTVQPHQSTEMTLERATSHIKCVYGGTMLAMMHGLPWLVIEST